VKRKEQRSVKAIQVKKKSVYRLYVSLEKNSIQISWNTNAQISVCIKLLAIKLGLKWTKPAEAINIIIVNS